MAIDSAPLVGRVLPSRASSPTTAYVLEPVGRDLPAAGQNAERDRQIERRRLLGQLGRGQVDDDAIVRAQEARVDHRPLDAVRALLDRRFGQADEHGLGQRPGETSTSTSTGTASMPSSEKVRSLASMGTKFGERGPG